MWTGMQNTSGVIEQSTLEALVQRFEEQGVLSTADILEIWPEAGVDLDRA